MEEASTAADRGQGGGASGTAHAGTHRGFVAGVVGDGGQVRSGRREVVIMDHGTGVAASVAAMVLLDEAEVELLAPADDPSTEVLDPLRIELWPTESADKVTLVDETRDPESRRLVLEQDWVADRLLKRFTHDRLAPTMPRPLVHGGAVSTSEGSTALVLGPSGTGKSTLVAHLAQAGCELINDEQVSVHVEAGLLGGFTRPIDIKPGGIRHLPRVEGLTPIRSGSDAMVTARQLGTRHRLTGTPVLMVLPERNDRAECCEFETLHPAEALDVLCANNLDLAREPLVALEAFAWLAATFPMWVLRYSRAAVAAEFVVGRLGSLEPMEPVRWEVIPTEAPITESTTNVGLLRPAAQVVTVHIDDRTVLFDGETLGVARLNPAGSNTWRRILAGVELGDADQPLVSELQAHGILVPAND